MAILISEDFETNTLGNDSLTPIYGGTGSDVCPANNEGEIVSNKSKSGSKSLRMRFVDQAQGEFQINSYAYYHVGQCPVHDYPAVTYIRWYQQWDSAFRFHGIGNKQFRFHHLYFVGVGIGSSPYPYCDFGIYETGWDPRTEGWPTDMYYLSQSNNCNTDEFRVDPVRDAGKWWMYEIKTDRTNKKVNIWVMPPTQSTPVLALWDTHDGDNTPDIHIPNLENPEAGHGEANEFQFNYINAIDVGEGGYTWFDELVIADSGPIGPLAGDNLMKFNLIASDYIAASGENTTAQLTAPAGKTTSEFQAGRIQDDENPTDAVTLDDGYYDENEWCIYATYDAVVDETYRFRLVKTVT